MSEDSGSRHRFSSMATYQFLTTWLLDAPLEQVWATIADYQSLTTWWPAVAQVTALEPHGSEGVGSRWQMTWKTPLSYTLTFESTITQIEPPNLLELAASGDLEGTGRWELSSTEAGTMVRYYWTVSTTQPWMNLLAVFLRPLMEWNHNAIMRQGGQGLAQFLGARLLTSSNS